MQCAVCSVQYIVCSVQFAMFSCPSANDTLPPQVITHREPRETLLCIAYVFEVSTSEHGAQHHIYRLVKD